MVVNLLAGFDFLHIPERDYALIYEVSDGGVSDKLVMVYVACSFDLGRLGLDTPSYRSF